MFKHLAVAALFCLSLISSAQASKAPFSKEATERYKNLEYGSVRVLTIPYSFTDEPVAAAAVVPLDLSIPAEWVVVNSWAYVDADVVSANSNTVAVGCETTNDLLTATDFSDDSDHAIVAGAVTATASTYLRTADGCTPTMTIGAGASGITAGRLIFNYAIKPIENGLAIPKIDLEP